MTALVVLSSYTGWQATRLQRELTRLQKQSLSAAQERERLANDLADIQRIATILTDPDSKQITMTPQRKDPSAMRVYWHPRLGIVVAGTQIFAPPGDHTLELWLFPKAPGQKPAPAGVVRPQRDGSLLLLVTAPSASLGGTRTLAITEESAAGSPQPTSAPIWTGVIE